MRSPLLSRPGAVAVGHDGVPGPVAAHYGDPLPEQRRAAEAAVLVDRSDRDVIVVGGPDRLSWLHSLTSQHLEQLDDGATTEVTVVLDGLSATVAMPQDQTVLDAAQASRADLPFACKGGVCGTCRARVTDGEVDMRRNYALEASEVEAGFVLTCQSYPVGDRVTVDFDA